ncbi:MAG: hypothetical protein O2890_01625, partial [Cyanobacteria bacterium]|nr:hypothetical protein [Cyanobacteriota bacterium]MDA0865118.1 hypothetical protein [Cyanobacteriota bacterium]
SGRSWLNKVTPYFPLACSKMHYRRHHNSPLCNLLLGFLQKTNLAIQLLQVNVLVNYLHGLRASGVVVLRLLRNA